MFIHDELIVEVEITNRQKIMEDVNEIDRIMVDSMSSVIEHVKIKTEASLMTRWFKEAEEVRDEYGDIKVMTGIDGKDPVYESLDAIIVKYGKA